MRSQIELCNVFHGWINRDGKEPTWFLVGSCRRTNLQMFQSCKSLSELARPPRSQAYQKLPHPSRFNFCRISLRHQVVLFTEAPPWWDDFQRYQTPDLSWTIAITAHGISVLSPFTRPEAAFISACTSLSLCPFPGLPITPLTGFCNPKEELLRARDWQV